MNKYECLHKKISIAYLSNIRVNYKAKNIKTSKLTKHYF